MSKRTTAWFAVAGSMLLAAGICWFAYNGGTYRFEVTSEQAQAAFEKALAERSERKAHDVVITNPRIKFENSQLYVGAKVSGEVKGRTAEADIDGVGRPYLRGRSLYAQIESLPTIQNLKIKKVENPNNRRGRISEALQRGWEATKKKVNEEIAERGWEEPVAHYKEAFRLWSEDRVLRALQDVLAKQPLKTFEGPKGIVIAMAVQEIGVDGNKGYAVLSIVQFGYSVFIAIIILLGAIAMTVALLRNPSLFMVVAMLPTDC